MDVRLETIEPIRVAYLRGTGPYQASLPPLWKRMGEYAGKRGLFKPGVWMLTIAHDNPNTTPPDQVRGDACISVDADFVPEDDIAIQTIPGGLYAVGRYVGPYTGLANAWGELGQSLPPAGHRMRGLPGFEVYRNSPMQVPPEELITEIYEPIEPV